MAECIELLIASINQQKSRGPSRCRWHGWQPASPSPNGITNPHQSINPKSTSSPTRTLVLDQNGSQFAASQYRSIGREITAAHRVAPAGCSGSSHCANRRSPLRQAEDGAATACEARIKPPDRGNGPPPAREARCRPPRSSRDCLRRR